MPGRGLGVPAQTGKGAPLLGRPAANDLRAQRYRFVELDLRLRVQGLEKGH